MSGGRFFEVREFAEVDSTNRYLLAEARRGAPEGLVAVADHQSAGRGRLGRRWEAPAGSSLLLSVLVRPPLPPDQLHLATAALALAAVAACRRISGVEPAVKWPNDLLMGDRKLAGVLAEVDPGAGDVQGLAPAVVVGIGVNLTFRGPPEAGGTCLSDASGRQIDRRSLQEALLEELEPRRAALDHDQGRAELAGELRSRCATLGRKVRIHQVGAELEGTAVDLTDSGHLVLDTPTGRHEVAAGDVVHLRTVNAPGVVTPSGPGQLY